MTADLDPRDLLLQAHTPAVMVPRFASAAPLEHVGHRYLVAEDGLWIEVNRPWLRFRALIAPIESRGIKLPFGRVAPELGFDGKEYEAAYAFDVEDLERLQTLLVHDAQLALPNEFAAWGVWNAKTHRLEYRALIAEESSPGSITFNRPRLEDHEHLAVDMHSHGSMGAFFSSTDDDDDAGEVKLSVVVGGLEHEPQFASRLCVLGLFVSPGSDHVSAYEGGT